MIKGKDIICISSIDWDFVWQGHQEIMSSFAKNGNRVLFIENTGVRRPSLKDFPRLKKRLVNWLNSAKGFRQGLPNLYVFSPLILPFPYSRIARRINRYLLLGAIKRWMKIMNFHEPIIWTFLPTGTALDIINNIDKEIVVYYCIADFYELADDARKVKRTEEELIKKSDLVFVQGEVLREKCSNLNKNVHIFPFGVNTKVFSDSDSPSVEIPEDIQKIPHPVIGYVGGIHRHVDLELIKFIAQTHKDWSMVLIGPKQTDISALLGIPNIFILGKKEFPDLPRYIKCFDVCVIPYKINEYTMTVYPTKLNEYHMMGKPVVATDLPEIKKFNAENADLVLIGKNYQQFSELVGQAISQKGRRLDQERRDSAQRNNWPARIEKMSQLIEASIQKKSNDTPDWKERFLHLYSVTKRNFLGIVFFVACVYLAMFYTPLLWWVAQPLKISQALQKADAIVVFAGGVGESGQARQGYEERTKYAAELYKAGYAKYLVFSSGYVYVFEEPKLMQALAVSLGVPKEAIILEEKAKNTYENIKFSNQIIKNHNWRKVLLITSPYNTRRAYLVSKKIADNTDFIFTPIPNSLFYAHPQRGINGEKIWLRATPKQIKGVIHEYLGIIYYWWRGWI